MAGSRKFVEKRSLDEADLDRVTGGLSLFSTQVHLQDPKKVNPFATHFDPVAALSTPTFATPLAKIIPGPSVVTTNTVDPDLARVLNGVQQLQQSNSALAQQNARYARAVHDLQNARQLDAVRHAQNPGTLSRALQQLTGQHAGVPQTARASGGTQRGSGGGSRGGGGSHARDDAGDRDVDSGSSRRGGGGGRGGHHPVSRDDTDATTRASRGREEHEPGGLPVQAGETEWRPPRASGITPGMLRPTSDVVRDITNETTAPTTTGTQTWTAADDWLNRTMFPELNRAGDAQDAVINRLLFPELNRPADAPSVEQRIDQQVNATSTMLPYGYLDPELRGDVNNGLDLPPSQPQSTSNTIIVSVDTTDVGNSVQSSIADGTSGSRPADLPAEIAEAGTVGDVPGQALVGVPADISSGNPVETG
jgi:hypothetical protein